MTPKCPDCRRDQEDCICFPSAKMKRTIDRQAAHIEMMREALKWIQNRCAGEAMPNWENTPHTGHSRGLILDRTNYALSTTPDQALEQFAAKVREQCAQACESMSGSDYSPKQCASAIRAIKDLP